MSDASAVARLEPIGIELRPGGGRILPLPLREGVGGRGAYSSSPRLTHPSPQPPPSRGGGECSVRSSLSVRLWAVANRAPADE